MQDDHSSPRPSPSPVLLLHGLLSSPQEFALVTNPLRMRGVPHQALSIPGYTLGDEPPALSWQAWRDAACTAIDACAPAGQPVILAGLCIGGVLAALAALEMPQRVAGLALISPTFTYDGWGLSPVRHLRRIGYLTGLDRFFFFSEREPYGVKNPRVREWVRQELQARKQSAVGPLRMPLRALRESERLMAEVHARLAVLHCPLLVIHAHEDEITRFASVERFFASLPLADKELVALENSYHMVTIDNDRLKVVEALDRFASRIAQRHASPDVRPSLRTAPATHTAALSLAA